MGTPLSALRIAALASAVAFAGLAPATAAPMVAPGTPAAQPDVVRVIDTTVVRRDRLHRDDGGVWKKKRHHFRDRRDVRRDHDHDGRNWDARDWDGRDWDGRDTDGRDWLYRPKATQKFAYDGYGNLRIYDGDGWDRNDWRDNDGRDWRKTYRKRPRIIRGTNSFEPRNISPELKDVLTAVPD